MSELDSDILEGFVEESNGLLEELEAVVEKLEDAEGDFPAALLEEFSQKIDRIMGASKTLLQMAPEHKGLSRIGTISELCKRLGYKAAEKKEIVFIPIFAAFWADTIEALQDMIDVIDNEKECNQVAEAFAPTLVKRLEWLAKRVETRESTGTKNNEGAEKLDNLGVDDLLKDLGI